MPDRQGASIVTAHAHEWMISASRSASVWGRIREVWRYRYIWWFFAARALEVLFAKTRFGWMWLVIRPLAPLITMALVFGGLMRAPSDGYPYFLFLLTGSIVWTAFDGPLGWSTRGLELNRHLVTKLYFPRMILPMSTITPGLAEPVVYLGVLILTVVYFYVTDGRWYVQLRPQLLMSIVCIAMSVSLAIAIGLWTSVWQARARDVRYIMGMLLGFWFYATPVIYPLSRIPPDWQWAVRLNPMTGIVEMFKWAVLGSGQADWGALGISAAVIAAIMAGGAWHFTRMENITLDKM